MPHPVAVLPALYMGALKVVTGLPSPAGSGDTGRYSGVEDCPDVDIHRCVHMNMIAAGWFYPGRGARTLVPARAAHPVREF